MARGPIELSIPGDGATRQTFRADDGAFELGRGDECSLQVDDGLVSRRHARFEGRPDGWYVSDCGSRNGTFLNGDRLAPGQEILLREGDQILAGSTLITVSSAGGAGHVSRASLPSIAAAPSWPTPAAPHVGPSRLRVGRAADNDIVIGDQSVSGHHLEAWLEDGELQVRDLGSRNGTFLGDDRVEQRTIPAGAVLRLGTDSTLAAAVLIERLGESPPAHASMPASAWPSAASADEALAAPGAMVEPPAAAAAEASAGRRTVRVGRAADNEIVIGDPSVSGHHLEAWLEDGELHVRDLGSRNGTFLGDERVECRAVPAGAVLRLGSEAVLPAAALLDLLGGAVAPDTPAAAAAPAAAPAHAAPPAPPAAAWGQPSFATSAAPPARTPAVGPELDVVRVGRAIDNDIVIGDQMVSSYHLEAWPTDDGIAVRDLNSRNGTYVDGERITQAVLPPGAVLRLGPAATLAVSAIMDRILSVPAPSMFFRHELELEHLLAGSELTRVVGREQKVILNGVDISIRRGQFVAIAGGSGTGKTTLVKVLNGYTPPDGGRVLVAPDRQGETRIGFVPQDDVIHRELPLKEGLVLSAMLRYPPGTPRDTVATRADEVLSELGLSEHARTLISRLSGGQRKRASVALELMTRPRLILLDEPTSGLDPASDRRLIRLLRALADSGYGVAVVTHNVANIVACDTVAFLAPGGYLVFWGTPEEAKQHFAVESYEEIYERIESEGTPQEWRRQFEASPYYQKLRETVAAGQGELGAVVQQAASRPVPGKDGEILKWQLAGLARRYYQILLGDRRNLALLLGQVPVIMLLARILFGRDVLQPRTAEAAFTSANKGLNLLFILGAMMVWLGTINAAREICKELGIWERERHAGVRPLPYLLSKILVLSGLCALQTVILTLMMLILWQVPGGAGAAFGIPLVGLLTAISGVTLGLAISASVPTADRAVALVPLVMIPQIMFGGTIIPLSDVGKAAETITLVVSARWAFEGLGRLTERATYLPEGHKIMGQVDGPWIVPVLALVALCLLFGALAGWLVMRQGGPAPGKPGLARALFGARGAR